MNSNNYGDKTAYYYNPTGTGCRVLIVGGSATVHPPDDELGFTGNYGLSASCEQNDYVHVMMRYCEFAASDTAFLVVQSRLWEEDFTNERLFAEFFEPAKDWAADVIVLFVGDHICQDSFDEKLFEKHYRKLIDYLKAENSKEILLCTTLFRSRCDKVIQKLAHSLSLPCIFMGSLLLEEGMLGNTGYKSAYLDSYPNDRGMRKIAQGILCLIDQHLHK